MKVKVKFFAAVREITGKREDVLDLESDTTVETLLGYLFAKYGHKLKEYVFDPATGSPRNHLQFLVDGRNISTLKGFGTRLSEGSSFAIIPPVGGG